MSTPDKSATPAVLQALKEAQAHHARGNLAEAERLYQAILRVQGGNLAALLFLGMLRQQQGRYDDCLALMAQVLARDPGCIEAYVNLGIALSAVGRHDEAVENLQQAIALQPDYVKAHFALAGARRGQGRLAEAEAGYLQALALKPDFVEAHGNLGIVLREQGRLAEAEASCLRALALRPDYVRSHNNLGIVLHEQGRLAEAEASFRRALASKADYGEAHSNLGATLKEQGRYAEAEASCRRAISIDPELAEAHGNLGNALRAQGRLAEAEAALVRATALRPDYAAARGILGIVRVEQGRLEEGEAALRHALELNPELPEVRSNLLLTLNYTATVSRAQHLEEHRAWARRHEAPLVAGRRAHENARNPDRRLRIGYVSPDFRRHSVAYFVESILAAHDRSSFEVHCYSNVVRPDGMTRRLTALADSARSIVGMSDARAAELVRSDGIDLLVDLAGHTSGGRLGLFALKPAPVQVSYVGYPATSGLSGIEWRLTDAHADPPGEGDGFHSETLARLPETFLCFRPPEEAPQVAPAPFQKHGRITFGSFNARQKVTREVVRAWASLLDRVPGSRLLLKGAGFADAAARGRIAAEFAEWGVRDDRLTLLPRDDGLETHLARYHEVDIGLDPFPYNGTATTLEALWMGVPVVSLAGDRHAARVGSSILANLGLDELVAGNTEDYIALAAALASDHLRLAQLRQTMRERIAASPLRDESGFARSLERLYREMWRSWCGTGGDTAAEDRDRTKG